MPSDRGGGGAVGRPSDPVWQFFTKLPSPQPPSTGEGDAQVDGRSAAFARPRARCIACGCIMIGQARQLKAHHARCGRRRRSTPDGGDANHDSAGDEGDDDDDMHRIPSVKHQLSPAEKLLVVKCHAYFKAEKQKEKFLVHRSAPWQTRDRVSKCLGISPKTVSHIIAEWNRCKDPTFQLRVPPLPPPSTTPATTTMQHLLEYADVLDGFMESRNAAELPVTAALLCEHLQNTHGVQVDVVKMRAFLRKQGYVPGPRTNGRRHFIRPPRPS